MKEKLIKYLTIGVLVLVVLNVVLIAFMLTGQRRLKPMDNPRPDRMRQDPGAHFMNDRLGFNKEQQTRFRQLLEEHRKSKDSLERELRFNNAEMIRMNLRGELNQQGIDSVIEENTRLHRQMDMELMNHFRDLKELCNEDQRKELEKLLLRSHGRMERGMMRREHMKPRN